MPPVERRLHAEDTLSLRERVGKVFRQIVMPRDVRMHQRIERIEFDDRAARGQRLGNRPAAHSACECQ